MVRKTDMTKRVSIRTLVLGVELLGFVLAYQWLVSTPPARTAARPLTVQPQNRADGPSDANVPQSPTITLRDQPEDVADCTSALRRVIEISEARPIWHHEMAGDPNDDVKPDNPGPGPEDVE